MPILFVEFMFNGHRVVLRADQILGVEEASDGQVEITTTNKGIIALDKYVGDKLQDDLMKIGR